MELRELMTFVTLADTLSFRKTAELLGYSQAAVTIRIRNLEKDLGVLLLERSGKTTALTSEGRAFYKYASGMLNLEKAAREAVRADDSPLTGTLRVGTIDSICATVFPDFLEDFHRAHPQVTVSVTVASPDELLEGLGSNRLDLVCLLDEIITDPRFDALLERENEVVFCAEKSTAARYAEIGLDELLTLPSILTEKDASYRRLLEQRLAQMHRTISPVIESRNTNLIIHLVCRDLGFSFLPHFIIADRIASGELAAFDVPECRLSVWYQILRSRSRYASREMQAFVGYASRQARKEPGLRRASRPS